LKASEDDTERVAAVEEDLPPLPDKVVPTTDEMDVASSPLKGAPLSEVDSHLLESEFGIDMPEEEEGGTDLQDMDTASSLVLGSHRDENGPEVPEAEDTIPQKRSSLEAAPVTTKTRKLNSGSSPSRPKKKASASTTPKRKYKPRKKLNSAPSSPVTEVSTISYEEQTELRDLTRYTKYVFLLRERWFIRVNF
jgi:hypothetical protein